MAPEVRKALKATGAAKRKSELLLLAKQPPSDQVAIAGQLRDGTASSVAEALRRLQRERGRHTDGEDSSSSPTPDDDDVEAVDDDEVEGAEEDDEPNSLPAIFSHLEQLQGLRDQVAAMLELATQLERAWTDDPAPDVTPLMTHLLNVKVALSRAHKLLSDRIVPERVCSECDPSASSCEHCAGKGWLCCIEAARLDDERLDTSV